jgi:transposase-like protein
VATSVRDPRLWVDGVHVNIRLQEHELCLLVLIGVRADGRTGAGRARRLDHGQAVSTATANRPSPWADLLRDCARRGMHAPVLAIGDGALGLWSALRQVFPTTREPGQVCAFCFVGLLRPTS